MSKFTFTKIVDVDRDLIFQISTDFQNFTKILPEYFKELRIIESSGNITKIEEKLQFLGKTVNVLTEHIVEKPNKHIVRMLNGQVKGTVFDERYESIGQQTEITINVDFVLHGGLKILGVFAKGKIKQSMNNVIDEFVRYTKSQAI